MEVNIDYSHTTFYKIECKDQNITSKYVGHTTNYDVRYKNHKNCSNNQNSNSKHFNYPLYITIRENGGWENWTMSIIEEISCNDVNEARERELYWINELKSSLNKIMPIHSQNFYEENKYEIRKRQKKYYENNKQKIRIINNEWKNNNIEKYKEYQKEYAKNHREKRKEKIMCECGTEFQSNNKWRHQQSKKHQNFMNSKES